MLEQLERQLEELKSEYGAGQVELSKLEQQVSSLNETLLRIAGAIHVIEEMLAEAEAEAAS